MASRPARHDITHPSEADANVSALASIGNLLPFQKHIIRSLIPAPSGGRREDDSERLGSSSDEDQDDPDALLVMARGLGIRSIVASILRLYDGPQHLVVIVNASAEEEKGLGDELTTMGVRKPGLRSIGHETTAKVRQELYLSGGLLSVTSRILVVDMLNKMIPTDLITGLVVLHAERISPTCVESFIARIFRQENKEGFIKAFSDEPEHFAGGLSPLQTVLGQLHMRRVELWPRFHKNIIRDLGKRRADVIELHQPLSRSMRNIQNAIVECLDATLGELKRGSSTIDVDDCTVENAIFRAFETIVRRQLDPVWHRLGPKTKQLVNDLRTLRSLLTYLITYDSVTFHSYLETILASQSSGSSSIPGAPKQNQSPWLFMEAANVIFREAKARAFIGDVKKQPSSQQSESNDGISMEEEEAAFGPSTSSAAVRPWWLPPGVEPTLEELPKWHLLREVLDEIEQDIHWTDTDLTGNKTNTILIMTQTERTCSQLRDYVSSMDASILGGASREEDATPGRKLMEKQLRNYFLWKGGLGNMNSNLRTTADVAPQPGTSNTNGDASRGAQGQYESEGLKRKEVWERGRAPPNKRRRQRGGSTAASSATSQGDLRSAPEALESEANSLAQFMDSAAQRNEVDEEAEQPAEGAINSESSADTFTQVDFDNYFGLLDMSDLVVVRPYSGDDDDRNLEELQPRFIVMYDPEPSFVRRIEVYRSTHPHVSIRVYFLMYAESVEEQRYLSSLRREKDSFERLIREKSMMALPLQADGRPAEQSSDERLLRTINSRLAGGQRTATSEPPRVIVDLREFRSSLPSMLHGAGLQVVPCTLQVGDYILTSDMCVERKSLSDLIQSFNSGRLYTQCELMSVHYQHPILLIEFDQDKSFSLQSMNEAKGKIVSRAITTKTKSQDVDIQSKLVLLTIAFPRLRIIWSSSPYATSDIFAELKNNYDEPDLDKVAAVGLDENSSSSAFSENSLNMTPQDILLSLPGITTKNFRLVSNSVRDLAELFELELDEIQHLIGIEAGRKLFEFCNKNVRGRLPAL
ncbi:DNA repair protein [Acaromyces ingoldii]|uniref:DNA repair protein n=1 Tax=Acaromyces ingoldii TaxID=215250 RepID=A0A316YFR0_9BASI|nr:DNA repair protein [Acaromyces ingoldii]PWN88390.1 DNA repair protein [Acaromyces ingoldii]